MARARRPAQQPSVMALVDGLKELFPGTRAESHTVHVGGVDCDIWWRVQPEALDGYLSSVRRDAKRALGAGRRSALHMALIHVQEQIETFDGARGELVIDSGGVRVVPRA